MKASRVENGDFWALCEATGRPLGTPEFVAGLENLLGRKIAGRAPGRRPKIEFPADYQLRLQ